MHLSSSHYYLLWYTAAVGSGRFGSTTLGWTHACWLNFWPQGFLRISFLGLLFSPKSIAVELLRPRLVVLWNKTLRLAISSRKVVLLSTTPLVVVGGFWNGRNSLSCSLLVYRLVEIYEISRSRGSGVAGGWDKQILVLRIAKKNILKNILNTCNWKKKRFSKKPWMRAPHAPLSSCSPELKTENC